MENNSKCKESKEKKMYKYSADDSDDETEILEESPCGRWLKRKEKVQQRDVPGIDAAYLAMDMEEGMEVVWNEVQFSERRNFKDQEEKIKTVFHNLTSLHHPTIVKFHAYWLDFKQESPRIVFITEYMAGSFKSFLLTTTKNGATIQLKAWKRWCIQILSGLQYLHSCNPPIIHGNLRLGTIFIQHNGLIKIGSVAPDAIHQNIKTCREHQKDHYFLAPEYSSSEPLSTAVDIYAFGICALEMTGIFEVSGTSENLNSNPEDTINNALESIKNISQRNFIKKCINPNPKDRPTARELLFHPILFEVHPLRLISAHCIVNNSKFFSDNVSENLINKKFPADHIIAEIKPSNKSRHVIDSKPSKSAPNPDILNQITAATKEQQQQIPKSLEYTVSKLPSSSLEIEKLLEDVKNGFYPLTSFHLSQPPAHHSMPASLPPTNSNNPPKSNSSKPVHNKAPTAAKLEGTLSHSNILNDLTCGGNNLEEGSDKLQNTGKDVLKLNSKNDSNVNGNSCYRNGNHLKNNGSRNGVNVTNNLAKIVKNGSKEKQDNVVDRNRATTDNSTKMVVKEENSNEVGINSGKDDRYNNPNSFNNNNNTINQYTETESNKENTYDQNGTNEGIKGNESLGKQDVEGIEDNNVTDGSGSDHGDQDEEEEKETSRILVMTGSLIEANHQSSSNGNNLTSNVEVIEDKAQLECDTDEGVIDTRKYNLTLVLKMENKLSRNLQCEITKNDSAQVLATELVNYGFINENDKEVTQNLIDELIRNNVKTPESTNTNIIDNINIGTYDEIGNKNINTTNDEIAKVIKSDNDIKEANPQLLNLTNIETFNNT
ncbi:unnamed protein product [Gordionus sp. m RMFG-2023]|uniref:nuclear receptor-binding protein homolog n=1 Tax=Gordionus sp. m RMFG-2023 TaxID=3053472 RepID=UPI0030E25699